MPADFTIPPGPGEPLRQLCERIAAVLRAGGSGGATAPLLAGIERALVASLRERLRDVTADLRRELEAALGAVADLERLADSGERTPALREEAPPVGLLRDGGERGGQGVGVPPSGGKDRPKPELQPLSPSSKDRLKPELQPLSPSSKDRLKPELQPLSPSSKDRLKPELQPLSPSSKDRLKPELQPLPLPVPNPTPAPVAQEAGPLRSDGRPACRTEKAKATGEPPVAGKPAEKADATGDSPVATKRKLPAASGPLQIACPTCGLVGRVPLDRLHHAFQCSGCREMFRVYSNGRAEAVTPRRRPRPERRRLRWAAALALLLAVLALTAWRGMRSPAAAAEAPLPADLEPRAEMFARAWLAQDVPGMRRLTDRACDNHLYPWLVRHRPPTVARAHPEDDPLAGVTVHLRMEPTGAGTTRVVARIDGLAAPATLTQDWAARGDAWYFVPPVPGRR
jgi:hypothetical protein